MKVISEVHLLNEEFGHSKRYHSKLVEEDGEFLILNEWGKIGGTQQRQEKGPFETKEEAIKKFKSLVAAKTADGYLEVGQKPRVKAGIDLFYPMKAAEAEPEEIEQLLDNPAWVAERKFDGARYLLKIFPNGDIKLHSRKTSVKDNLPVDKTGNVPHLVDEAAYLAKEAPGVSEGTVLDGEILWDLDEKRGESHRMVTSVMGALPEKALLRQKEGGFVSMMVYDLPWFQGQSMFEVPFRDRRAQLEKIFKGKGLRFMSPVTQIFKDKRAFLEKMWQEGKEGIVLKDPQGLYQPGDRPKHNWVKVKKQQTDEYVITGFEDGKGKYVGMVGAIVFGQYSKKGELIKVSQCSGFSDEERKKISKTPKSYLGRVVEVEFQERTPDGSLRHPRFYRWRPDKDAKECLLKK